mgnify:CR=1 FL=1|tara:strand:- start:324 stop:896 length:573 start_codon:yes stop_codon:yes gene_type:complete
MPWKYNGATLRVGKEFTGTDGTQYPKVWMRYSTDEKKAIGITWEDPPASEAAFDNRFYAGRNSDGSLIPKSLTDVLWVDDDGNAINEPLTGTQGKTKGLKTVAIETAKTQAASLLAPYDWYVVRNAEKSTAIPSDVTTYRDAVRTACANIEAAINAVKTHAKFMALYDTPVDGDGNPTGNAPIVDWPDSL